MKPHCAAALLALASACSAADDGAVVHAILARSCVSCHGPTAAKAGLRLDTAAGIRAGGKHGAVVVPGYPADSPLYQRVMLPGDDPDVMPAKGDHLTSADCDTIAAWISAGAPAPAIAAAPAPSAAAPAAPGTAAPAPGTRPAAVAAAAGRLSPDFLPVQAILARSCIGCHGADKQKGHLRLDTPEGIRAGGKSGAAVVAGAPEKSTLYQRVSLGADDPDVMPADGPHLSAAELSTIATWIRAGAHMDAGVVLATNSGAVAAPTKPFDMQSAPDTPLDHLAQGMAAPAPGAVDAITQAGGWCRPVSKNGALLEVDARGIPAGEWSTQLHAIVHLGPHVAWLNCAGTAITDGECSELTQLPHLSRLHLERTAITDSALRQVAACTGLTYLNLYGTAVDDGGIGQLTPLRQLAQLYLRGTKATPAGAAALVAKIPGLQVVFDEDLPTGALPEGKKKKKGK